MTLGLKKIPAVTGKPYTHLIYRKRQRFFLNVLAESLNFRWETNRMSKSHRNSCQNHWKERYISRKLTGNRTKAFMLLWCGLSVPCCATSSHCVPNAPHKNSPLRSFWNLKKAPKQKDFFELCAIRTARVNIYIFSDGHESPVKVIDLGTAPKKLL